MSKPGRDGMANLVAFGYRQVTPAEKKRLVQRHFDPIARTYDLADVLLSFGLDGRWRNVGTALLGLQNGDRVLDACGGTGRLAKLAAQRVRPGGRVVVADFNLPMMEAGREALGADEERSLIWFVQSDAEDLSFPDATFDAVTMGFGLRNLAHPEQGLHECLRVLAPGGRLMILEFSVPRNRLLGAVYQAYSFYWMPLAGRLICGTGAPFRYLAESVRVFPGPEEMAATIRSAGFSDVRFRRLFNGIAVVYLGAKPGQPASGRE
jgi:demethylmenaquinone methyltransferase/2-methoxy-6-polyprenyl-1,4-benzoquinol methylase